MTYSYRVAMIEKDLITFAALSRSRSSLLPRRETDEIFPNHALRIDPARSCSSETPLQAW
jgi:hypothetical protein